MFLRDLNKDLKKKQNTFLKVKYKKQTANVFFSNKLHCTYFFVMIFCFKSFVIDGAKSNWG